MQVQFKVFQGCVFLVTVYCIVDCVVRSARVIFIDFGVRGDNKTSMYRPRGALARAMYNKQISDDRLKQLDHTQWYQVNLEVLQPAVRQIYVPSTLDSETQDFLNHCNDKSDQILTQLWYSIVKTFLHFFMSQTDINGLLGRGSMFIFSKDKIGSLLERPLGEDGDLIDLGAGDGLVTKTLANFYSRVYVTEVSKTMRWTLKKRGFRLLEIDGWTEKQYDAVSCLNLLDRCESPLTILDQIKDTLKPGGKVIIALVLPIHQYVESRSNHQPIQWLPIQGNTFEEQTNSFINDVLLPAGFVVEKWTRLPYLCEGDMYQAYYWLDDAVFIARLKS